MNSAAVVDQRVTEVLQMRLDGYSTAQIKDLTKHWKVTERTINNYISKAVDKLTNINLATAEETRGTILHDLWDLYRINKSKGDIKEMHRLLCSIAKNSGLDKISVNINKDGERQLQDLSNDELVNLLGSNDKED